MGSPFPTTPAPSRPCSTTGARASETATFRTPGYPWLPLVYIVAVLAVVASNVVASPSDAGIGLLMTLAGIPAYYFWTRGKRAA